MPRSTPTTLALPPFAGATRRLILILLGVFFADALLRIVLPNSFYGSLYLHLLLVPSMLVHGQIWQPFTYGFLPIGILGTLFALLTLWFVGSMLEDIRGPRWIYELFLVSSVGGGVVATAVSYTRLFHLDPAQNIGIGPYAAIYGLLMAIAMLMGDQEFLVFFLIRIKVKYLVAIYILIDLATLLKSDDTFQACLHLCGALCGFLFVRFAARRSLTYAFTERYYALRNNFYRNKRRRAARKFEVYMGKQGRKVNFDKDGRYIDPDKDPNDRSWMN